MSHQKFASRVIALIALNLLVKMVWIFFVERKVQLEVGFANYGEYYSILNFTLILGIINDPGLHNYLIQSLASSSSLNNSSKFLQLKFFLAVAYIAVSWAIALIIGIGGLLLWLLLAYQVLFSFLNYQRSFLKAHQLYTAEVFLSVFDKALLIVAFLPLLYFNFGLQWSVRVYVLAQIISVFIAVACCGFYLYKKQITLFKAVCFSFDFSLLKKLVPYALFAFLVLAYQKTDAILLVKLLPNGEEQSGVYAAAYRFLDASSMLPILFASLFYPTLCNLITRKLSIGTLVRDSLFTLLGLSLIIAFVSWFFRAPLMELFYQQQNTPQLELLFGLLMFALPLIVMYYVFSSVFTAQERFRILNGVSALGFAVNLLMNFILIPRYQVVGAGMASLISFALVALLYLLFYHQNFKPLTQKNAYLKLALFTAFLWVFGQIITSFALHWMIMLPLYAILSLTLALMLKIVKTPKQFFKARHCQ